MRNQFLSPVTGAMAFALRAIGGAFNSIATICEEGLHGQADAIPIEPGVVEVLTFRGVVEWLTTNRPADAKVVRAALLREHGDGISKVITVFLDTANGLVLRPNGVPYGRAQRVLQIDQELLDFFGSRSMVIFE